MTTLTKEQRKKLTVSLHDVELLLADIKHGSTELDDVKSWCETLIENAIDEAENPQDYV